MSDTNIPVQTIAKRAKKVKKDISVLQREYEVVKLRTAGKTYQEIADTLGYANHTGAREAWLRAVERTPIESVNEYRQIHLTRLEKLIEIYWPKVEAGDLQAAPHLMAVLKEEAALLGLYAPKESKVEVTTYEGRALRETAERIIKILEAHGDTEGGMGEIISQS
jgi:uncharacterized protein YerC